MANWVVVAALGSILATVWLGWLLYKINQPQDRTQTRNRGGGDSGAGGGTSPSKDWHAGSDGGGDGGGD